VVLFLFLLLVFKYLQKN